ncbi:MDR family MFS transporter [Microbacterium sp. A82]|uniref:MDR family MFS transporter n=1 Tax=Microbacterium sp. A82 TaxID=3450452 RepID=UPI003F30080F
MTRASDTERIDAPPSVSRARFWLIYFALAAGMFLSSLNHTVLSAAMPTIVGELGGVQFQAWMTTAFLITATITMPIYGRLADSYGHRWLYLSAVAAFTLGSLGAGLSVDFWSLVAWRSVQGIGGGGLMVLSMAIIGMLVEPRARAKFMAPLNVIFAVSAVLGPLIGGLVVDQLSWPWVFHINVPVGALCIAVGVFALRLPSPVQRVRMDIAGMIALVFVTVSVLLAIEQVSAYGMLPPSPLASASIIVAVVSTIAFVMIERRAAAPVMPLGLFRDRQFFLSTAVGFILGFVLIAVLSFMPTVLQMGKGQSAAVAGLLITPMNGGWIVVSLIVGVLVSRTGRYKAWMTIGSILASIAVISLGLLRPDTPIWMVSLVLLVLGIGMGMCFNLLIVVAQNAVSRDVLGTATGAHNYVREVGAAVGVAVVGALFTMSLHSRLTEVYRSYGYSTPDAQSRASVLSPDDLAAHSGSLHDDLAAAYFEAFTPTMLWLIPVLIAVVVMCALLRADAFDAAPSEQRA